MRFALFLAVLALAGLSVWGVYEHKHRTAAEIRADSAMADYRRLAADSARTVAAEHQADAVADTLRRSINSARDTIHALHHELSNLDSHVDSTLAVAITVHDSMVAYRDAYTAQRVATGRLLAAAHLLADSLLTDLDRNRQAAVDSARADRDRWKATADRLAKSVVELKGSGKLFGFIPKPPKWLAAGIGCGIGALVDQKDRGRGCGIGGAMLVVAAPTR